MSDIDFGAPDCYFRRHTDLADLPLTADTLAAEMAQMAGERKRRIQATLDEDDWDRYLHWHESHKALPAFLQIVDRLEDADYWRLLADVWSGMDVVFRDLATWRRLFKSPRAGRENLMTPSERMRFDALPDRVDVFRGFGFPPAGLASRGRWIATVPSSSRATSPGARA